MTKTKNKSFFYKIGSAVGITINHMLDFYNDFFSRIRSISISDFTSRFIAVFLLNIAFAAFNSMRSGSGNVYMSVFIPFLIVNTLIVFISCVYKSSHLFTLTTAMLLTIGAGLQAYMISPDSSDAISQVTKLAVIQFAGIVTSLLIIPVISLIISGKIPLKSVSIVLFIISVAIYLLLIVAGTEINGTKAWLYIGSFSIQLTEIAKLIGIIQFSLFVIDKQADDKKKSIYSFLLLMTHIGFLAFLNELGTAIILVITFFLTKIVFLDNKKHIFKEIIALILVACVAITALYGISKIKLPESDEAVTEETTVASEDASDSSATSETEEKNPLTDAVKNTFLRIQLIYPKLEKRVCVFLRIGDITKDDTHQIDMARQAMKWTDLFGTPKGSLATVPEVSSDFVFVYLLVRLGVIGACIMILAFILMLADTYIFTAKTKRYEESVIATAFVSTIIIQAFICMLSNIGLFPIVGLPMPFISEGGTSVCVVLIMCIYILFFMRKNKTTEMTVKNNG